MKFDQDFCLNLCYELNPWVRCAFGNVCDMSHICFIDKIKMIDILGMIFLISGSIFPRNDNIFKFD